MALITLPDVKTALGLGNTGDYDEVLAGYVDAAVAVIEDIVGPVVTGTRTATFNGGASSVVLGGPISEITSVTVNGVALTATQYTANLAAGIVYGGSQYGTYGFASGIQNVIVQYSVGSDDDPPANVKLAALELVRFWWQIGQQGNRPSFGEAAEADEYTPSGFAVPRRVIELCGPNMRAPGIG